MKHNPFNNVLPAASAKGGKEVPRDPLDVRELLTSNSRKAVISKSGELEIQSEGKKEASVELMKERYWGSHRALFDRRLTLETRAMRQSFPQFHLLRCERTLRYHRWVVARAGELFWTGVLETHSGGVYQVIAVYPSDYPFSEIRVYVIQPYIPATEHRFEDGRLCLYEHGGKGEGFDSARTTAVTIVAWTAAWLHAYEIWRETGEWPTVESAS